jgi:hypothetical protein
MSTPQQRIQNGTTDRVLPASRSRMCPNRALARRGAGLATTCPSIAAPVQERSSGLELGNLKLNGIGTKANTKSATKLRNVEAFLRLGEAARSRW